MTKVTLTADAPSTKHARRRVPAARSRGSLRERRHDAALNRTFERSERFPPTTSETPKAGLRSAGLGLILSFPFSEGSSRWLTTTTSW